MSCEVEARTTGALKLDEILEPIIFHMDFHSLLASRLVCRQWRSAATPQLRKKARIHLYDFKLGAPDSNKRNQEDTSLDDLSNTLKQSDAFNFLFPCNSFSFTQTSSGDIWGNLSDAGFQNFLYTHGSKYIKELSLSFRDTCINSRYQVPHESVVMEQIQNLVLNQTPNLHFLSLNIESEIEWKEKYCPSWGKLVSLQTTDEEYKEIHQKILCLPPSSRNTSLKVLKLVDELSSKVFETVILLCPNLEEIIFDDGSFHPYCIEPVNRLRFVKTLTFDLNPWIFENMEEISSALQQQQGELKLRQFTISFDDSQTNRAQLLCFVDQQFQERVVSVINQILESSAGSLETFVWHGVTYMDGLKLPLLLPNVTKLELSQWNGDNRTDLFPSDFFNLATTFPRINHISLHLNTEKNMDNFVRFFNPDFNSPVLPVKTVDIIVDKKYSGSKDLSTENLHWVCDLFPDASVRSNNCKDSV